MSATATRPLHEQYSLREPREYGNYIDGEWVKSSSGQTFENRNPANTDDLVGTFQESNADDTARAVDAAAKWAARSTSSGSSAARAPGSAASMRLRSAIACSSRRAGGRSASSA